MEQILVEHKKLSGSDLMQNPKDPDMDLVYVISIK